MWKRYIEQNKIREKQAEETKADPMFVELGGRRAEESGHSLMMPYS